MARRVRPGSCLFAGTRSTLQVFGNKPWATQEGCWHTAQNAAQICPRPSLCPIPILWPSGLSSGIKAPSTLYNVKHFSSSRVKDAPRDDVDTTVDHCTPFVCPPRSPSLNGTCWGLWYHSAISFFCIFSIMMNMAGVDRYPAPRMLMFVRIPSASCRSEHFRLELNTYFFSIELNESYYKLIVRDRGQCVFRGRLDLISQPQPPAREIILSLLLFCLSTVSSLLPPSKISL